MNNGFIPSLEFAQPYEAYVSSESCIRFGGTGVSSNYADNRCDPPRRNDDLHSWPIWPLAALYTFASNTAIAAAQFYSMQLCWPTSRHTML